MKNFLKTFISLLILGALVYQFHTTLYKVYAPVWQDVVGVFVKVVPCAKPIPYNLGTFDTQFNISKDYFLSALAEAEAIWEKPYGKQLFIYAPTDSNADVLKINLIYDYRQQATSKLESLGITVNDNRASYDELKAKFTALQAQYEQEKADFEGRLAAWNKTDRTDRQIFQALQALQTDVNNKADEINALVVALNRLVAILNLSVEKFNTTNQTRGESFEEGVYTTDGLNSQIDIYEFSSRAKLVRVLAHELGHALGLDHVDDPKAIMYKLNQGDNETLTKTDLSALKAKCATK